MIHVLSSEGRALEAGIIVLVTGLCPLENERIMNSIQQFYVNVTGRNSYMLFSPGSPIWNQLKDTKQSKVASIR